MKTLRRWIARIALGLVALLMLCIAVLVAANWRDDPLTPEATRLLAPPAPASDAPNAYDVLLGMDAPDDQDALTAGQRIHAEYERQFVELDRKWRQMARENPDRAFYDYDKWPRSKTIVETQSLYKTKFRCPLKGADCVDFYLRRKAELRQFIAQQTLLRQRYQQFSQIPVLNEPIKHTTSDFIFDIRSYGLLPQAAEMRHAEATFACDAGDLATGANILAEEIHVHRRLLASNGGSLAKMIAVALLRRDYAVLSDAIEHWPLLARQPALAPAWQPLQAREYSLRQMFELEAASGANTLHYFFSEHPQNIRQPSDGSDWEWEISEWKEWLRNRFTLPQATINLNAFKMARLAQSMEGDPATLNARRQAYADWLAQEQDQMLSWTSWRSLRNPGGKRLVFASSPYDGTYLFAYPERVHDLDGYIRLIALQAALRRDGVPLANVANYVQRAGPDLRSPYDGQPMRWDAASATLSFEGRQRNSLNPDDAPKTFSVRLKTGAAEGH